MRLLRVSAVMLVLASCTRGRSDLAGRTNALEVADADQEDGALAVEEGSAQALPIATDDADGDGVIAALDLDDADPELGLVPRGVCRRPFALDDQCPPDRDGDGVPEELDCDDGNAGVHPQAVELRCNGLDENCDGMDDCDTDGDGALDRNDVDPRNPERRSDEVDAEEPIVE